MLKGLVTIFFPEVLANDKVDQYVKTGDTESFAMARRLIKEEGLLVGGSSGSAVSGALRAAKDLAKGAKVVVILPDSIRNYLQKFVDDKWLAETEFNT